MRILLVASEFPPGPGGIGTHACAVASGLADLDHDVRVLACQHYVEPDERSRFNSSFSFPIETLADSSNPGGTALARLRQIRSALRNHRPDVVVISGGRTEWLVALACQLARVPYVAVVHGSELGGSRWARKLTMAALNRAEHIIAVSDFTASRLEPQANRLPPITIIHNGADSQRFSVDPDAGARFRSAFGVGSRPMVVTVGNVSERKGQHAVVRSLPLVVDQVPDVVYVVIGRPAEVHVLRQIADELGVNENLIVTGALDSADIVAADNAADVFAMTSVETTDGDIEGFGIAVIEAALCGTPAIVSRGTGAEETVIDGETGIVVDAKSPQSVANALISLLSDPSLRAEMSAAAQRRAQTECNWERRLTEYEMVLQDVVNRPIVKHRVRAGCPHAAANPAETRNAVVISHTPHHMTDDGSVVGFGPTLRELDRLASLFDELVHIAPLHSEPPPGYSLAYEAENIRYVPVRLAGGPTWWHRLAAIPTVPAWARTIRRELRDAQVVHIRCPAGISMVALGVLAMRRTPRIRWVKYAGNWMPEHPDAVTNRFQRWWLRRGLACAAVTVNGNWSNQPVWVYEFDNPTLTSTEIEHGRSCGLNKQLNGPPKITFIGRVDTAKGAHIAFDVCKRLRARGMDIHLDIVGEGPLCAGFEQSTSEGWLTLHGWLTRHELEMILCDAHVLLLPSESEGFPKVVAEAMAFGVVPVTSRVSSLQQVMDETGGGIVVDHLSVDEWTDAVYALLNDPPRWRSHHDDGIIAVERFGYQRYLERVKELLGK